MTTTLEKPMVPHMIAPPLQKQDSAQSSLSVPLDSEHPVRRLWTRTDYYKAGELGLFGPEERLELINGEVWKKVIPQGVPHAFGVGLVADALRAAFSGGFHIREEKPIVLNDLTEPEPDVVVVQGTLRQATGHPTPANIVLLVEVSETTLKFDQTYKAEAYARSGIADYWVLNQRARQLEVRRDPGLLGDNQWGYRSLQILMEDAQVSPLAAPGIVINIADLMPELAAVSPAEDAAHNAISADTPESHQDTASLEAS